MRKSFRAAGFYERLRDVLGERVGRKKQWTQDEFAKAVTDAGFPMLQARVSELKKAPVRAYNLVEIEAICEVLGILPESLVFPKKRTVLADEPESVVVPPTKPAKKKHA